MVGCGKCLFVTALVMVGLAYYLYVPCPDDRLKQQGFISFELSLWNFLISSSQLLRPLGLNYEAHYVRFLLDFGGGIIMPTIYKEEVQAEEASFDGVRVMIFSPVGASQPLPGIVYIHGGGWVIGSPAGAYENLARRLAKEVNAVVISIDYRLAPEHRFPGAINDCEVATKHLMKNADRYNIDPERIAIAGDSAGGNLAAAVSLKLRKKTNLPSLKLQVLLVPALQAIDLHTPSYQQYANSLVLPCGTMAYYYSLYAQGHLQNMQAMMVNNHTSAATKQSFASSYLNHDKIPSKYNYVKPKTDFGDDDVWKQLQGILLNPLFSPLLAKDLSNLPPAYIWTAQHDVLRDDGFWYAQRLREAGVEVKHRNYELGFHNFLQMFHNTTEEGNIELGQIIKFIKENI